MADWLEVALEVASVDAELVAELLRQHCPGGVAIEQVAPYLNQDHETAIVKAYLPADERWTTLRPSLRLALRLAPLEQPPRWRRVRRRREREWLEGWKRYFRPILVGSRLVIKPTWSPYTPQADEIVIEIDPGMAFGTGQHPTTAMCLRALANLVQPGQRVLDIGTGSGILAIAAARLGSQRVLALDTDPLAIAAAKENAGANEVQQVVEVREGTLDQGLREHEGFDIVAANLSELTLERLAPLVGQALAPGGHLVASGFLEDATAGLSEVFEGNGLRVERVLKEGLWRAIIAQKPAGR